MAATAAAGTQAVSVMAGAILPHLFQLSEDVMKLAQNRELLKYNVGLMKSLLIDINKPFKDQKKPLPTTFVDVLFPRVQEALEKVKPLLKPSDPQQCFCNIKRAIEIKKWNAKFEKLFEQLCRESQTVLNAQEIARFTEGRQGFRVKIKKIVFKVLLWT